MSLESILTGKFTGQLLDRITLRNVVAISKSDTALLEKEGYVVLLDAADDGLVVKVTTSGGGVITLKLAVNEIFPVLVKKVWSSTTTATTVYLCT